MQQVFVVMARVCAQLGWKSENVQNNIVKKISFLLLTTTYESSNQPYTSNTLKIRRIFARVFEHTSHTHVITGAAIAVRTDGRRSSGRQISDTLHFSLHIRYLYKFLVASAFLFFNSQTNQTRF